MFAYQTKSGIKRIEKPFTFFKKLRTHGHVDPEGNVTTPFNFFKEFNLEIREVEDDKTPIKVVLSDGSLDRHDEIIDPDGWELKNYKKNPIVLFAHNSYEFLPIGKMQKVKIENKKLVGEVVFTPKEIPQSGMGPQGWVVGELVRNKFIRAGSVGFIIKKVEFNDDDDTLIIRKQELVEFSIVPVPANPNALIENGMDPATANDMQILSTWHDSENEAGYICGINKISGDDVAIEKMLKNMDSKLTKILKQIEIDGEIISHKTSDVPGQNQVPGQGGAPKPGDFFEEMLEGRDGKRNKTS